MTGIDPNGRPMDPGTGRLVPVAFLKIRGTRMPRHGSKGAGGTGVPHLLFSMVLAALECLGAALQRPPDALQCHGAALQRRLEALECLDSVFLNRFEALECPDSALSNRFGALECPDAALQRRLEALECHGAALGRDLRHWSAPTHDFGKGFGALESLGALRSESRTGTGAAWNGQCAREIMNPRSHGSSRGTTCTPGACNNLTSLDLSVRSFHRTVTITFAYMRRQKSAKSAKRSVVKHSRAIGVQIAVWSSR
jgi:hypothetical protein